MSNLGTGNVRYIIAPDIEHHISLAEWKRRWKDAVVIAPHGLREKREKQGNEEVEFAVVFGPGDGGEKLPEGLRGEFEVEYFDT